MVQTEKYFNTWNTRSPAVMEFLPARFGICPGAFSNSANAYTKYEFSEKMRLMEHQKDGKYACLMAAHGGTVMKMEYAKTDPYTVLCKYSAVENGEWGLRFWLTVAFGFFGEKGVMNGYEGTFRSYKIAVAFRNEPIRTAYTMHPDDEGQKMTELGYYADELTCENPKWAVAKFNLEETPEIVFAVSVMNDIDQAKERAGWALGQDMEALKEQAFAGEMKEGGELASALGAIRDVMAWNTIYDHKNHRPMTSLTRFWIDRKFGGWFVWLDDVFYHALICLISGDQDMARHNIMAALGNGCPAGNLACLMSEFTEWVDRSQPPIGAFVVYKYYLFTGDTALLKVAYRQLGRALRWWQENRRTKNGLFAYGSSNIGNGHFNGTKLAAKDESSMDNSPMHDTAVYDKDTKMLDMNDIGLNCLLVVEAEHLAKMAEALGEKEDIESYLTFAEELKKNIDENLYDEERKIYANRKLNGEYVSVSPTSFYPFIAGIPSEERQRELLKHMFHEGEFYTHAPMPAIWAKDPAVKDNVYWRGRMWPPLNFITHAGLRRMRQDKGAYMLAKRSMEIFDVGWTNERACYENFNAFTGEGRSKDTDPFYGWGALIPLMWILEHIDMDIDNGLNIAASSEFRFDLENIQIRGGKYAYKVTEYSCEFKKDGVRILLVRKGMGRIRNIVIENHYIGFVLDAQPFKGADLYLPGVEKKIVLINGETMPPEEERYLIAPEKETKVQIWY